MIRASGARVDREPNGHQVRQIRGPYPERSTGICRERKTLEDLKAIARNRADGLHPSRLCGPAACQGARRLRDGQNWVVKMEHSMSRALRLPPGRS